VSDDEAIKRIELVLKAAALNVITPALATQWLVPLFKRLLEPQPAQSASFIKREA